jgi:predicted small integral membrane protein
MAMSVKTFVPIVLIVICAALVFFVRPHYVEGRIGLSSRYNTSSATLPDVDYLMMLDKIYLLAYVFIIAALARVVLTSWRGADDAAEKSITRADRIWVSVLLAAYIAANATVVLPALV